MLINKKDSLGLIVKYDISKASVLNKYNMDFCCGGKQSLEDACRDKGLDVGKVILELQQHTSFPAGHINRFNEWPLGFLLDYILINHHTFLTKELPQIQELMNKVLGVHGSAHKELEQISAQFQNLRMELEMHLAKEEQILFPYINELLQAREERKEITNFHCGHISQPIIVMEMEHESAGKALSQIRNLSSNFGAPEDACDSFRLLYGKLQELEADLHQHIHLENNILFPAATELETAICAS